MTGSSQQDKRSDGHHQGARDCQSNGPPLARLEPQRSKHHDEPRQPPKRIEGGPYDQDHNRADDQRSIAPKQLRQCYPGGSNHHRRSQATGKPQPTVWKKKKGYEQCRPTRRAKSLGSCLYQTRIVQYARFHLFHRSLQCQ